LSDFDSFELPEQLQTALRDMGYVTPTEIQLQAIPPALEGADIIGVAQTGTGKTAAFGIPMVTALARTPSAQGLVVAPTRELALQIHEVLRQLTAEFPMIRSCVLIGGASMREQIAALARSPRIAVATPGRLLDHIRQGTISLANVRVMVLDEADRMLDIGFEPQLREIFRHVPRRRQTLLFSATFAPEIERLASRHLTDPVKVAIGALSQPVDQVRQSFVKTTTMEKDAVLLKELAARKGSVLIFVRTKDRTERLAQMLARSGFQAEHIHGDLAQGQRTRVLDSFREEETRILVATDLASRGLDIPHIAHVINYDLPRDPQDYIHRIGRTARAGATGESLSLLSLEDRSEWITLSRHLAPNVVMPLPKTSVRMFRPSHRSR
jgi:ATP-dependent RNA helicase DeaD